MRAVCRGANPHHIVVAVVLALVLVLGACGNDDDDAAPAAGDAPTAESTPSDDGTAGDDTGIEGSVSDDDLVVPRQYLQGDWCDSDGGSWSIEGDTATLTEENGGTAEFAVDILFVEGGGVSLISQTDDEFVFGLPDDNVTFTRGSC